MQASNFSDQNQLKHDTSRLFKIQPVYEYLINLIHTVVVVVAMMIQKKHPQSQHSSDQKCFFLYYYYKYLLQNLSFVYNSEQELSMEKSINLWMGGLLIFSFSKKCIFYEYPTAYKGKDNTWCTSSELYTINMSTPRHIEIVSHTL